MYVQSSTKGKVTKQPSLHNTAMVYIYFTYPHCTAYFKQMYSIVLYCIVLCIVQYRVIATIGRYGGKIFVFDSRMKQSIHVRTSYSILYTRTCSENDIPVCNAFMFILKPIQDGPKKESPIFAKISPVLYRCTWNSNPLEFLQNLFSFQRYGILFSFRFFNSAQTYYI